MSKVKSNDGLQRSAGHSDAIFDFVRDATDFVVGTTKLVAPRTNLVGGTTCHVAGRTAERSETDLSVTKAAKRDRRRARSTLSSTKLVSYPTRLVANPTWSSFSRARASPAL